MATATRPKRKKKTEKKSIPRAKVEPKLHGYPFVLDGDPREHAFYAPDEKKAATYARAWAKKHREGRTIRAREEI